MRALEAQPPQFLLDLLQLAGVKGISMMLALLVQQSLLVLNVSLLLGFEGVQPLLNLLLLHLARSFASSIPAFATLFAPSSPSSRFRVRCRCERPLPAFHAVFSPVPT